MRDKEDKATRRPRPRAAAGLNEAAQKSAAPNNAGLNNADAGAGDPSDAERPPFLQLWRDSRTGQMRAYFRKRGAPRVALDTSPGAPSLADQVRALTAEFTPPDPRPGTIGGALDAYELGADFRALDPATRKGYARYLARFGREIGDVRLSDVDAAWLLDLRDALAERGHRAANIAMQVLKNALKRPMAVGDLPAGLFDHIERVRRPRDLGEPHPVWTTAEVAAALEEAHPGLARAIALARFHGLRRGDVIRLPESARRRGRIALITAKAQIPVDVTERQELAAVLARTPRTATTIAYAASGRPYKDGAELDRELQALIAALHADGRARARLTLHGLRHTFGVELALNGATIPEIMAAFGHQTPHAATIYVRQAERFRLGDAALARVSEHPARRRAVDEGTS